MANSISQRSEQLNHIQKLISDFANEPQEKLIKFCLDNRHSLEDIADALGVTSVALRKKYPHLLSKEAKA